MNEESQRRVDAAMAEEGPVLWFWLSFADDTGFLGACLVPGVNFIQAVHLSHSLGCNPGGQVLGMPVPVADPPLDKVGRLLGREEAEALSESLESLA